MFNCDLKLPPMFIVGLLVSVPPSRSVLLAGAALEVDLGGKKATSCSGAVQSTSPVGCGGSVISSCHADAPWEAAK